MAKINYSNEAIEYIAKMADGGMRDAITLMDKCLAFSNDLTIDNVVKALGTVDYEIMINLCGAVVEHESEDIIRIIEEIHNSGKDLKQFCKQFMNFLLDVQKYDLIRDFEYLQIPEIDYVVEHLDWLCDNRSYNCKHLLSTMLKLNSDIKWDTSPKAMIEATLLLEVDE